MKIQNLNLSALKYFIDTIETGSFSKAASINHVTRPAISQAILRLEGWAGVQLMKHEKKNLILTDRGLRFFRKAKKAFDNFQVDMKLTNANPDRLRLGCSASLAENFLIPGLKRFKNISDLEICTGTSPQLIQKLQNREISIALLIDKPKIPEVTTKVIGNGHFQVFSKSGQLEQLLFVTEDRPEVMALKKWLLKKKKSVQFVKVESWTLAKKLAEGVNGACFIPELIEPTKLKKVSTPGLDEKFQVLLAHQRKELMSAAEERFCSLL